MKKLIILSIILNTSFICFSQKMREGIEFKLNTKKISDAKSVTWFGWDYSHLIIDDPKLNSKDVKTIIVPY